MGHFIRYDLLPLWFDVGPMFKQSWPDKIPRCPNIVNYAVHFINTHTFVDLDRNHVISINFFAILMFPYVYPFLSIL